MSDEGETITVELPVDAAQGITGTLEVDEIIARENEGPEAAATFRQWRQPFIEALKERHESHFDQKGKE